MADLDQKTQLRAPNGFFAAKVDEAGRIKLPAKIREYLGLMPDKAMFATCNDVNATMGKVYFNGSWEKTKEILTAQKEHRAAAQAFMRLSNAYGGDVEIDSNGRVTLPQELRSLLDLNGKDVQLLIFGDVIQIHRAADLQRNVESDKKLVGDNQATLEGLGVQ